MIGHRILFTPAFLVEVRRLGWQETLRQFRARCLESCPRPQADLSGEVVPIQTT